MPPSFPAHQGVGIQDRDPAPRPPVMGQVHKLQRDGLAKGAKPGDQNVQDLARPNPGGCV